MASYAVAKERCGVVAAVQRCKANPQEEGTVADPCLLFLL